MEVRVVSPESELFRGEATEVYARAIDEGEFGILANHQPVLVALAPASVRVKTEGGQEHAFEVGGGFLQFRDNRLTVLADEVTAGE